MMPTHRDAARMNSAIVYLPADDEVGRCVVGIEGVNTVVFGRDDRYVHGIRAVDDLCASDYHGCASRFPSTMRKASLLRNLPRASRAPMRNVIESAFSKWRSRHSPGRAQMPA